VGARSEPQQRHVVDRGDGLRILDAGPQLERAVGEVRRLPECEHALSGLGRGDRRAQRRRLRARGRVVAGDRRLALELLLVIGGAVQLQLVGERQVQLGALTREQVVVQRLAQERVAEAEAGLPAGDQHLLGDRLAQRRLHGVELQPGDRRERSLVEHAPDRDHARNPLRVGRELLDPRDERVAQALGRGAAAVEPGREQLLGVERVALAALEQPVEQRLVGLGAEDVAQRLGQLQAIERPQLDPADAVEALELGQQRSQRVAAVQLVGAVAEQQQHPRLAHGPRRVGDERARRAVGPVHVLERQHERLALGEDLQQLEHRLEQPQLSRRVRARVAPVGVVVEAWQDRRQLDAVGRRQLPERLVTASDDRPQRPQQRRVGQVALGLLQTLAAQEDHSARAVQRLSLLELGHQPRLADARVTPEQHQARQA